MLSKWLVRVFADGPDNNQGKPEDREHAIRVATAILLVTVARADAVFDEQELRRVTALVTERFHLSADEARDLVNSADAKAEELVSLYDTTQLLHKLLSEEEKADIIRFLWEVAYADGQLDKYEDALVLKISDLLYVSRARVMGLKFESKNRGQLT